MKIPVLFLLLAIGSSGLVAAPEAPPTDVVLLEHAKVDGAFAQGMPLLANARYKVSAGRRVAPGNVELHTADTDIFYIMEGSATFVTGGTVVEPATVGPGEIRGKAITGGTTRHLVKGDVIVIPKNVPHWFTEVSGPFLYFVVKVTE
jgi:glc operon protein GlcG